ncbi:MAG: HemK family protein methyltransferase, partial [Patescibacteria group bacterium]
RYKPLIPRDETEYWVSGVIKSKEPTPDVGKLPDIGSRLILDMFAGSGCCGIAVLKNIPNGHCDFVDIEDNCLKQIRFNLKLNGIDKKRYRIIKSDIFEKLLTPSVNSKRYDVILANPPYIGLGEKSKVQKSVLNFEPKQALFAKDNGLYFIEKFLEKAKNYLAEDGVIYLEFGYNQKIAVEKLLKKFNYENFEFHKDQFNKWRFVKIS